MTYEEVIKKLNFLIRSYQNLIDNQVSEGEIVGPGVKGTWKADTPIIESYQNMIEALTLAKLVIKKYQMLKLDYNARLKDDMAAMLDKVRADIFEYESDCRLSVDEYPSCKQCTDNVYETIYRIIDKYKAEIGPQEK
ncbi:MAG: hypothetical protein IKE92_13575 [Clostridiales bacterium]|nr:hypothetical protein [Clostridiales bacterium]